jgi:hypothetical protein
MTETASWATPESSGPYKHLQMQEQQFGIVRQEMMRLTMMSGTASLAIVSDCELVRLGANDLSSSKGEAGVSRSTLMLGARNIGK